MESPWISILINLVWIKHRFQEICIGSPWYFIDISKDVIHIDQGLFLFKLSAQIHSSYQNVSYENTNTIAIIRQTKHQATYLR